MPELVTGTGYLRVGQYVFLEGEWRLEGGKPLVNELFKVTKADAFSYKKPIILKKGEKEIYNLDEDLSLYPEEYDTLYEIGVGLLGNGKLFIMLPSGKSYYYLEEQGIITNFTPDTEIGGFTEEMIPPKDPKVLREYTIRDMKDKIHYVVVNSSYKDEKIVLDFTVNRVKLKRVTEDEKTILENNWNEYVANGLIRILRYPREVV